VHTDSILYPKSAAEKKKIVKYFIDENAVVMAVAINGNQLPIDQTILGKEFEKTTVTIPVMLDLQEETSVSITYSTPAVETSKSSIAFFAQKQPGRENEPFTLEVSYGKDFIPTIIAPKAQIERSGVSFTTTLDTSKIFALGF